MEIWKAIEDTDGKYEVSNTGKVRSNGTHVTKSAKELKQKIDKYGYPCLCIYIDGKPKSRTVHRLVAAAFIPNPHNLPQVNHIDGNKENNHVENLEWCTASRNVKHAFDTGLKEKSRIHAAEQSKINNAKSSKRVIATDPDGVETEYPSISEAARALGMSRRNLQEALQTNTRRQTAGGYKVRFKE